MLVTSTFRVSKQIFYLFSTSVTGIAPNRKTVPRAEIVGTAD